MNVDLGDRVAGTLVVADTAPRGRSAWPVSSTPIPGGCPTPCANRSVNSGPLLEVVCRDNEALLALINDVIRAIAGVRAPPRTFTYLHFQNQTYSWGMG